MRSSPISGGGCATGSASVVKDDAQRLAVARPDPAHPVAQVDTIVAACASHGPMADRKDDAITLVERHHLDARLHARPLLRQHELATGEVSIRPREQECDLQWEDVLPVEILVEAVVVPFTVPEQERRRLRLCAMTKEIAGASPVSPGTSRD